MSKIKPSSANKLEKVTLPCLVLPGMFSTERQVLIKLPDGREIDALVDHRSVAVNGAVQVGNPIEGFVNVFVVQYDKTTQQALVDLPQGSFSKGPRIQVPSKLLQAAA